jgi:hypothetical protein
MHRTLNRQLTSHPHYHLLKLYHTINIITFDLSIDHHTNDFPELVISHYQTCAAIEGKLNKNGSTAKVGLKAHVGK